MAFPSKDKDTKNPIRGHNHVRPLGPQTPENAQIDCVTADCTLACTSGAYGYLCTDGKVYCKYYSFFISFSNSSNDCNIYL